MALLTLKDVGKIYVSEGNVSVGIRGVSLSFDRGEFVAVTGKSGSGKSTLLNVISGMDSYEEGELLIEGQPTSHYLQPEWEEYREKYISFIFQDYNIIESFTVLQNVELALMHVEDKHERRRRALELLDRVGLSGQIRQKGSKLSGGQKQRTVIARALAKDSPIILADEPTGNLDSATSAEIIALLREVSRDKLLIVVTHNFEEVAEVATRHVRVFDGAIESDRVLTQSQVSEKKESETAPAPRKKTKDFRNGLTLGRAIFMAKPRLSIFLCLLMIVGALGIFFVTTLCGEANEAFEPNYMFEYMEGRVVLTRQNGQVMTEEELAALVTEYGAKDYLHYDILLDTGYFGGVRFRSSEGYIKSFSAHPTYGETFGDSIVGRYPTAPNEVFLYLPISYQPEFGKETLLLDTVEYLSTALRVTGVAYYYDNNLPAKCLFTDEGFRNMTAIYYLSGQSSVSTTIKMSDGGRVFLDLHSYDLFPSYEVEEGKLYIVESEYQKLKKQYASRNPQTTVTLTSTYYKYDWYWSNSSQSTTFQKVFTDSDLTEVTPEMPKEFSPIRTYGGVIISPTLLCQMAEDVLASSYRQASLFFADDKAAHEAAERLNAAGYIAVPSDTTYVPDGATAILNLIAALALMAVWILSIVFLAFFINLCSARALGAFKGDMAIMRSMGIPVKVIRVGMYVRMLLSIIPAYVFVAAAAIAVFTVPKWNGFFVFLYPWQYVLIGVGILLLTIRITHRQIRRLFGESVKKSLRGGAAE